MTTEQNTDPSPRCSTELPAASGVSPRVVALTGMSGAGKQLASRYFEDMKWRVVDNLPPRLLPELVRLESESDTPLCVVCDVRGGHIDDLLPTLDTLRARNIPVTLLFLDASDEELLFRFKETRRPHPLFERAGGIQPAIRSERELLNPLRACADIIIDTTGRLPQELRAALLDAFAPTGELRQHPLTVTVASFGFKHGIPLDADLLFDVRFLQNPHYDDTLRPRDGRDPDVEAYVMADERTACFLDRLYDLIGWSLPHYITEGKAYLTIGIGCTGGRHRSVVVSEKLGRFLKERGYRVRVQHRDLKEDEGGTTARGN
ncbi:MAG: RNase adapter RapZ [Armatimonadaceae bacterium]